MVCPERQRLWKIYRDSLGEFSQSVNALAGAPMESFFERRLRSEALHEYVKIARAEWERHVVEHMCED